MATHPLWTEEYWLLLLQIYLKKPIGIKPTYARSMVELSLELHIPPYIPHEKMEEFDLNDLPSIQALWKAYANNPKKLQKEARRIRKMSGFGKPEEFYEGVTTAETFEKDFKPIEKATGFGGSYREIIMKKFRIFYQTKLGGLHLMVLL